MQIHGLVTWVTASREKQWKGPILVIYCLLYGRGGMPAGLSFLPVLAYHPLGQQCLGWAKQRGFSAARLKVPVWKMNKKHSSHCCQLGSF